jgi:hypothetical protein
MRYAKSANASYILRALSRRLQADPRLNSALAQIEKKILAQKNEI